MMEIKTLLGIPIAHKDIFVTKDYTTTAGSKCSKTTRALLMRPLLPNLKILVCYYSWQTEL